MIRIKTLLSTLTLSLALAGSAQAFDFGGLKDKANSAINENGGSELLNLGKSIYSAVDGNATASKYAKQMMGALQTGKYSKVFDYFDKIKGAGLTDSQLSAWNEVKNKVSGFVMEQSFEFDQEAANSLVGKAVEALNGNNTSAASNYLAKLKNAVSLSSEQKSLLSEIQANLLPVIAGK